jgi:CHAT domain-containing protein
LLEVREGQAEWHSRFTALKAEILIWQGLSKQSLELLRQDLPPSMRSSDTEVWRELTQASAYTNLSKFDLAARALADAKDLAQASHRELLGYVALREGTLADFQNTPDTAASFYRDSLRLAREQQDSYLEASALGSLGLLETEQGHYDSAVDWNREALRVSEAAGAKGLAAKIQINTGWSYFELGDYDNALATFRQAEEAARSAGLVKDRVICRVNTGAVEYYLHDYRDAEKHSLEALQLARNLDEKRLVAETLNTLSGIELAEGHLGDAERANQEALSFSRSIGDHGGEMAEMLVTGRIEEQRKQYREAEHLLETVIGDQNVDLATRWEAEARRAEVYDAENRPSKADREYRRAVTTIEQARRSIEDEELRLSFLTSAIDFYNDYLDFLIEHQRIEQALQFADLKRSETLTEGLASNNKVAPSPSKLSPQDLSRKLGATLLFYWIAQNHSYLWVATPRTVAYFRLPPEPKLRPLVKTYRKAILDGHDVLPSDNAIGQQLYAMLIGPAEEFLPKNAHVILLPDECLYGLSFETLIAAQPKPHFWIEDVTISTATSMALLSAAAGRAAGTEKNLLLVGNAKSPNSDFPDLAQAPAEMQKVSLHFAVSERTILEGERATASAYIESHPERYAYLHFVTHATSSETQPLESAVILTRERGSYKLYARDIVTHRLNARLVTISACNGAGSRSYAGEGLVGLSWAFLRAGAHNVVASLWEVSDVSSTAELMDAFYAGLDRGEDAATALRKAKLFILKSNRGRVFEKPYYWAPFELYAGS